MKLETRNQKPETRSNQLPVWVAGTGCTKFGELFDESVESLARVAALEALAEAKLQTKDIDLLVVGNMLLHRLEGQAHVGRLLGDAMGYAGPAMAVEGACASGGLAVATAVMAIRAGMARNVLVVGVEKMTDVSNGMITRALMGAGAREEAMAGATFPSLYALMHREYQEKYAKTDEQMAAMAVWGHARAIGNPLAQFHKTITAEQVMKSPVVAEPIRVLHCAPISDGAAALVLSNQKPVTRNQQSISITGSGVGGDTLQLSRRKSLTSLQATKRALAQAVSQILNFQFSIFKLGVVEIHDCFSVAGYMAMEDLGLCKPGTAAESLGKKGMPAINPSGGLKACGHPVGATGVKQVVSVVLYLREHGGVGLAHNVGGTGGTAVVHILSNQKPDTSNQEWKVKQ
jgi:acetyl-CoA C-acetyltransferase